MRWQVGKTYRHRSLKFNEYGVWHVLAEDGGALTAINITPTDTSQSTNVCRNQDESWEEIELTDHMKLEIVKWLTRPT